VRSAKDAHAGGLGPDEQATAIKPGRPHQEVAAIAALFSDSLKALDLVAAEQAKWLIGIAVDLAAAARSTGLTASASLLAGDSYTNGEAETLVTALKRTAETQMKALTSAQARLAEMAAEREADSKRAASAISVRESATPLDAALANMVSNLDLAQQNAVANQQAMNLIAQASIAAGLNLLLSRSASHDPVEN